MVLDALSGPPHPQAEPLRHDLECENRSPGPPLHELSPEPGGNVDVGDGKHKAIGPSLNDSRLYCAMKLPG